MVRVFPSDCGLGAVVGGSPALCGRGASGISRRLRRRSQRTPQMKEESGRQKEGLSFNCNEEREGEKKQEKESRKRGEMEFGVLKPPATLRRIETLNLLGCLI